MTAIEIVEIIIVLLCVAAYGFMLYFKVKGNVVGAVSELIALAEKTGLPGSEKMAQVVDALYAKVPAWLRKIFTKERLQDIAQWIFDWMRRYADTYVEMAKDDTNDAELKETAIEVGTEAITELMTQLMTAGLQELHDLAVEKGVLTDDLKTKKDYAQAIIRAVLNKA